MFQFRKITNALTSLRRQNKLAKWKAVANHIKLPVVKQTVNTLDGVHPSIFKGYGHDFENFKVYQPGDDVSAIDWKSSSRSQNILVKRFQTNSNTNMVFLIDSGRILLSRSGSGEIKLEIVKNICQVFCDSAIKRLDAVGIVAGDESRIMNERSRLNPNEIKVLLKKLNVLNSINSPNTNYSRVLNYANSFFKKRTFFVMVFDETSFFENMHEKIIYIRRLKERHDIFAISIRNVNPFLNNLPKMNGQTVNINDFKRLPAYFRDDAIAELVEKEMNKQRKTIRKGFNSLGIPLICVNGTDDMVKKLSKTLKRRKLLNIVNLTASDNLPDGFVGPQSYSYTMLIVSLAGICFAIISAIFYTINLFINTQKVSLSKKNKPISKRKLKNIFIDILGQIRDEYDSKNISDDDVYYELSRLIREYASLKTGENLRNLTLSELDDSYVLLKELIKELYIPEFSLLDSDDKEKISPAILLDSTKNLLKKW